MPPSERGTARSVAHRGHRRDVGRARVAASTANDASASSPLTAALLHLQHTVGNRAVRHLIEGRATPLEPGTRHGLEQFFGTDLTSVRIRTGAAADEICDVVGGDAFTVGNDVVVRSDRRSRTPEAERHLLAHEIAHVVQQQRGPVEGEAGSTGVHISGREDRFERDAELAAKQFTARFG